MGLSLRRKRKNRPLSRVKAVLSVPNELNHTWSMDFMTDSLRDGRRVRVFNVLDDCNWESLAIECGISFPAERVIRVLGQLEEEVGLPNQIRVDNGPEFISKVFQSWCKRRILTFYLFNQVSLHKMPISSDSIVFLERIYWMLTGLRI